MSTTDLIAAAVLIGPGAVLSVPVLLAQRGAKSDSAAIRAVLAASAAERAAALAQQNDGPAPPPPGEHAPEPAPGPAVHLATVINFPTHRRAA